MIIKDDGNDVNKKTTFHKITNPCFSTCIIFEYLIYPPLFMGCGHRVRK